jgi:hypothetical protein
MKAHNDKGRYLIATAILKSDDVSNKLSEDALECVLAYQGEDINKTDKRVFDVLMKNTQVENRYLGGDDEPIVSIKWSEDREHSEVIAELVNKIMEALNSK